MSIIEPNSKLVQWRLHLVKFEYDIVYKKGTQNKNADALSRIKIDININERQSIKGTCGDTIHSNRENQNDGIPTAE